MNNILGKSLNFTGEGIGGAVLGAMAAEVIPFNPWLAGIFGAAFLVRMIVKAAEKYNASKSQNPKIIIPSSKSNGNGLGLMFALAISASLLAGCVSHPLLRAESLATAYEVAQPYMERTCANVAVYPGYEVVFTEPECGEAHHGFGGIIGGCGQYAHIRCFAVGGNDGGKTSVQCQAIERLRTE